MPIAGPRSARRRSGGSRREVLALQAGCDRRCGAGRRQQAEDGARRHRLAAAGFADHARGTRRARCAKDTPSDARRRRCAPPAMRRLSTSSSGRGHPCAIRGSRRSRSASPSRLMPSSVSAMHRPGAMLSQVAGLHVGARRGQHVAPGRRRRRHAEAEEAERALGQQHPAEHAGRQHGDAARGSWAARGATSCRSRSCRSRARPRRIRARGSTAPCRARRAPPTGM